MILNFKRGNQLKIFIQTSKINYRLNVITILLLFLAIIISSCTNYDEMYSDKDFTFYDADDFKNHQNLSVKTINIKSDSILNPHDISLLKDKIILIDNESTKPIHLIDLNSYSYLGGYGKIGQGPQEIQSPSFISDRNQNSFLIYDPQSKKILAHTINSLKKNAPIFVRKIEEDQNCNAISISDHNFFYTDFLDDSARLFLIDTLTNKKTGFGSLLKNAKKHDPSVFAQACDAKMARKKNSIVLAYDYAPFFEIFDFETKKWKSFMTLDQFKPKYRQVKRNNYKIFGHINGKTRRGFIDVKISDKYIYLLYSGDFEEKGKSDMGDTILVFDLQGNPITLYSLEKPLSSFAVINDHSIIGLNMDINVNILRFDFENNIIPTL